MAKKLNLSWRDFEHFAVLQKALDCTLDEFILLAENNLTKDLYTRNDILRELDIQEKELNEKILTKNTKHIQEFKLRQRALHVLRGLSVFLILFQKLNLLSFFRGRTC